MDELNPRAIPQNNPQQNTPNIVPPPPTNTDVRVRTMESDAQAVARGIEPVAQVVTPPPAPQGPSIGTQTPMATIPKPAAVEQTPTPAPLPDVRESKSGRLLLWFILFILIIGLGWGTYKYGLPLYRAMMPAAPEATTEPTPTPVEAVIPTPPPAPPAVTPLGTMRDTLPKIETDGTVSSITMALAAEAAKAGVVSGTITEIAIMNAGAPMSFDTYITALLPEAQANGLTGILTAALDPVFSAYIYHDERGAWPGYIAKINPASQIDPVTLTSRIQAIETSSYKNLFLADPGTPSTFRTGQARDKYIDRFVSFTKEGALFNYGIFGDYLIINTSNNGLVKALDLLKL